ncbi:MAG TPA: TonB-dependent receptor plug domain-containing protein, partial [Thermoanaerobaculia bacterium]|nr:TonB-dependent receptor plug domain-containing protein [Thermoanaerobaculia bacterium]
ISVTPQASTTYEKKFVEELPVQRDIHDTVLLTPGVNNNGPSGAITIAGSQSYENLYLVNGVVVNENLRGQAFTLFIEDAIQETTTSTSAVSAEYGRFGGGVVNTITKSGGNEVHASVRDSLTNDTWAEKTPLTGARNSTNNNRYEGTLGGYFLKDRLWFFGAGRNFDQNTTGITSKVTAITYPIENDEKRYEGKLTLTPFQGHSIVGSYIKIDQTQAGNSFGTILDLNSVYTRQVPQDLKAFNYNGIFSDSFYAVAQYSQRKFTFEHSGSEFTDIIKGTLLLDRPSGARFWSPTFCGVCEPESRDNKNTVVKGSYFLSNDAVGAHEMVFGYDTFDDIRKADNHQSGSDFRIYMTGVVIQNGQVFPRAVGQPDPTKAGTTFIQWNPILQGSKGTNFRTDSFFYNDKWRLNDRWTFNLGLRYDGNDGEDSQGQKVAKDNRISPRLAAGYDLKGNGDWIVNGGYAQYVTSIANSQADQTSQGGNPATYRWFYRGPDINPTGTATVDSATAIQTIFNWFNSQGGVHDTRDLFLVDIPGGTSVIRGSLDSPYTQEVSLGLTKRLGTRGLLRTDIVRRDSKDFYATRIDRSTGQVTTANGDLTDLAVIQNTSNAERQYLGLHTSFNYRFTDKFTLGGIWTLSETKGDFIGENTASGPLSVDLTYPEYVQKSWFNPKGDLPTDQRNIVRLWGLFDIFKTSKNALNVSVLQNYYSGTPYGIVGGVNPSPYVKNPGYIEPPTAVTYYYSARDKFRTDNITATDLAINYSFYWNGPFGKQYEVFLEPEILNVFNEKGVINVDKTVLDATNTASLKGFNPFTDKPVQGVNYKLGPNFGKPLLPTDYQTPRTFRFSVGLRF